MVINTLPRSGHIFLTPGSFHTWFLLWIPSVVECEIRVVKITKPFSSPSWFFPLEFYQSYKNLIKSGIGTSLYKFFCFYFGKRIAERLLLFAREVTELLEELRREQNRWQRRASEVSKRTTDSFRDIYVMLYINNLCSLITRNRKGGFDHKSLEMLQ